MRVALVLDNPKRDLNGLLIVAHHLLSAGNEVVVVPMYQQGYDVPLLAPDAIVVNYARPVNARLLASYREMGIPVVVMDTEGGVLSESGSDAPENWARSFRERGTAGLVDRYLFWGERLHDAFRRYSGMGTEQLKVTGCPRYDFCSTTWRGMLSHARSGFVLVNTNFSALNPAFTRSEAEEIRAFEKAGWERDYTRMLFSELAAVYPRYLDSIDQAVRANPDRMFLVRPHPFENAGFYRERFAGLDNLVVDGAGDVLNVIAHSECVVHLNCGTAVETLLLERTAVSLEFLNTERLRAHAPLPSRISCSASSQDHLHCLIRQPSLRPAPAVRAALYASFARPWFHDIDGDAGARVARAVLEVAAGRGVRRSLRRSIKGGAPEASFGQLAQGLAANLAGSLRVASWRARHAPARAEKLVSAAQVRAAMSGLQAHAGCKPLHVEQARHPVTGVALASVIVRPFPVDMN